MWDIKLINLVGLTKFEGGKFANIDVKGRLYLKAINRVQVTQAIFFFTDFRYKIMPLSRSLMTIHH